ncbi:unnamed protein product [Trichobilharzia szidati]|nr:unnamed protein product [Trichobilharzia szidati]
MNYQAKGLNDLFGTLYWIWNDNLLNTSCNESNPLGNREYLKKKPSKYISPLLLHKQESQCFTQDDPLHDAVGPKYSSFSKFSPHHNNGKNQPSGDGSTTPGTFQSTKEFTRRRIIIPPRRRKTITGVNIAKTINTIGNLNDLIKAPSPTVLHNGKTLTIEPKITTNEPNQLSHLTKPQSISHLTLNEDHSYPPCASLLTSSSTSSSRWRPWIAQSPTVTHPTNTWSTSMPYSLGQVSCVNPNQGNCLQVFVMNEETSRLQVLSYPIRPNMTARELNNLIAFQMRIFDSKDFGLFAYINGTEIQLEDELHMAEFTNTTSDILHSGHTLPNTTNANQTTIATTTKTTTTPSRSQTGTLNSLKDPESHPFKSHASISSRSESTTTSSSCGESRSQQTTIQRIRKPSKSRPAWWIMCGSNSQQTQTQKHQPVNPSIENSIHTEVIGKNQDLGKHKPILVYRRKSGYFALSDRLLTGMKSAQQQQQQNSG